MTHAERAAFIKNFFETECVSLLNAKGKEYSRGEDDANSNFKRLGKELNLEPRKVLFVYLKKHLDAITYYIANGKTESEAIETRIADAINYLYILASLIKEENDSFKDEPVKKRSFDPMQTQAKILPRTERLD